MDAIDFLQFITLANVTIFNARLSRRLRRLTGCVHTANNQLFTLIMVTVYLSNCLTFQCISF